MSHAVSRQRRTPGLRFGGSPLHLLGRSALAFALLAGFSTAHAQQQPLREVFASRLQQRVNGVMAMMGYVQTPDVTSGSLHISDGTTDNPSFNNTSLGGGFTWSRDFPLYLEGTAGYARYDPKFIASDGIEERWVPAKWNSFVATVGVGWDVHLAEELVLRPIAMGSYGRVVSDVTFGVRFVNDNFDKNIDFLAHGRLESTGLGGSLMLDYEHYREKYEIDVELRYTNIYMHSTGDTAPAVRGHARNENANLWARWRAPTGMHALGRPVRYVLEFAHTNYFGQYVDALNLQHLTSFGIGLELDTSKYHPLWISRARAVMRYVTGPNVEGWSLGLAVTFD